MNLGIFLMPLTPAGRRMGTANAARKPGSVVLSVRSASFI